MFGVERSRGPPHFTAAASASRCRQSADRSARRPVCERGAFTTSRVTLPSRVRPVGRSRWTCPTSTRRGSGTGKRRRRAPASKDRSAETPKALVTSGDTSVTSPRAVSTLTTPASPFAATVHANGSAEAGISERGREIAEGAPRPQLQGALGLMDDARTQADVSEPPAGNCATERQRVHREWTFSQPRIVQLFWVRRRQPGKVPGPARTVGRLVTRDDIVEVCEAAEAMGRLAQRTARISSRWCRSTLGAGAMPAPRVSATDAP